MWFRLHQTGSITQTQMSLGINNLMIDIVCAMEAKVVNEIWGVGRGLHECKVPMTVSET